MSKPGLCGDNPKFVYESAVRVGSAGLAGRNVSYSYLVWCEGYKDHQVRRNSKRQTTQDRHVTVA